MQTLMYLLSLILMPFETFSWAFSSGTAFMPSNDNMCNKYGEKTISTMVTFPAPFEKIPTVLISTKSFYLGSEAAIMVTYVSSVTTTHFWITWRSWYRWSVCFSEMTWFAYSDEQPPTKTNSTTTNLTAINTTTPAVIVPITTSQRLYTIANLKIDTIVIICLVSSAANTIFSLVLCFVFIKGKQRSQPRLEESSGCMSGMKNVGRKFLESIMSRESQDEISQN